MYQLHCAHSHFITIVTPSGLGLLEMSNVDEALRMNHAQRATANISSAPSSQDRCGSGEGKGATRFVKMKVILAIRK